MSEDQSRNNGEKTGKPQPPVEHQFKPGNPGRPKGARNKLGEQFLEDLYADWQANGVETLQRVREEKPDQYLKVVASILPKDLNVNINQMDDLTDDQLVQRIRSLDAAIRPFLDAQGASDVDGRAGSETAH
ncbi:hypothetical protein EVC10_073 [Rhizobium phage RHph_Y25]|nr:hypothetical protein EVC10_073 [Rhizobium phage RHph_Y25]